MKIPKIPLKWLLPIFLIFIIVTTLISINLANQPDTTQTTDNPPANRPKYLLSSKQLPAAWKFDLEMFVGQQYFLQIKTNKPLSFAIETIEFTSAQQAQAYVNASFVRLNSTGLELRFYQDKPRVNLTGTDVGYNWQVKSPCCFSRGVTFSIGSIYLYIFGSQESTWDQITLLFQEQAYNILSYLGKSIPAQLQPPSLASSSEHTPFSFFVATLALPVISLYQTKRTRL